MENKEAELGKMEKDTYIVNLTYSVIFTILWGWLTFTVYESVFRLEYIGIRSLLILAAFIVGVVMNSLPIAKEEYIKESSCYTIALAIIYALWVSYTFILPSGLTKSNVLFSLFLWGFTFAIIVMNSIIIEDSDEP